MLSSILIACLFSFVLHGRQPLDAPRLLEARDQATDAVELRFTIKEWHAPPSPELLEAAKQVNKDATIVFRSGSYSKSVILTRAPGLEKTRVQVRERDDGKLSLDPDIVICAVFDDRTERLEAREITPGSYRVGGTIVEGKAFVPRLPQPIHNLLGWATYGGSSGFGSLRQAVESGLARSTADEKDPNRHRISVVDDAGGLHEWVWLVFDAEAQAVRPLTYAYWSGTQDHKGPPALEVVASKWKEAEAFHIPISIDLSEIVASGPRAGEKLRTMSVTVTSCKVLNDNFSPSDLAIRFPVGTTVIDMINDLHFRVEGKPWAFGDGEPGSEGGL